MILFRYILIFLFTISTSLFASDSIEAFRAKKMLKIITNNVDHPFKARYFIKILKPSDEPNAWSIGPAIALRENLVNKLTDRELMAIVAHEIAHTENAHLVSRLGYIIGGAVVAVFDTNNDQSYSQRYMGFNEYISLKQEMQADCNAYNWLADLEEQGFDISPLDLNSATTKVVGVDFSTIDPETEQYFRDLPPYIRFKKIESGYGPECKF